MPNRNLGFTGYSGPTKPFSHKDILRVCYAFNTLYERYRASGGEIDSQLFNMIIDVKEQIIRWEQRSAKLDAEARRQRNQRAAKKQDERETNEENFFHDREKDFMESESDAASESASDIPESTRAALEQYKLTKGLRPNVTSEPLDTSEYKKSGLV